ncbi:MAG: alpha/beta hydrolase [Deltaproteobacteria bacterium]|nr:alpha/beta hydrolase [Deltaproteobacteria bacterium]
MKSLIKDTVKLSLVLFFVSGCANDLFYFPNSKLYQTPAYLNLQYESVYFNSKDGTKLHGWFMPSKGKALGTVVHFHGNAQNISSHFRMVSWLPERNYNVFVFDYRGYGKSDGETERQGIFEDSVSALRYVAGRNDVDKNNIFLIGQSLGGANCIAVAATVKDIKIRAVVIDSAFSSYQLIARDKIAYFSILSWFKTPLSKMLVSDKMSPVEYINKISPIPVFLIHGKKDKVIPIYHGKILFKKAKMPKTMLVIEEGKHIEAFSRTGDTVKNKIIKYLNKYKYLNR